MSNYTRSPYPYLMIRIKAFGNVLQTGHNLELVRLRIQY